MLPQANPRKTTNPALHPTLFSIEATAQDESRSDEEHVLLGIRNINWASQIQEPEQLRWMHLSNGEIEFDTFVGRALDAYGLDKQGKAVVISRFFNRFLSTLEMPAFQGKKLRADQASTDVQLPGHSEETKFNFMAIPYFLLDKARQRTEDHRSKVHWVQPLVQSAYHLDSSTARENQQAIRRLHGNISEVIHVPRLWLLSIGDKFIATCSPTPIYDIEGSSITTSNIGRNPFPPTIRVTMSSGFVFCLERDKCSVWFQFLYHLKCTAMVSVGEYENMDVGNYEYRLQKDGSLIEGRNWQSILQSNSSHEPLFILASPGQTESVNRSLSTIPLEGKYSIEASTTDDKGYPRASTDVLSPETLDAYNIPYYWDFPKAGAQKKLIVAQHLSKLDRKVLYDHTRRLRAMEHTNSTDYYTSNSEDPYYWTPKYVMDAAKSQLAKAVREDDSHRGEDKAGIESQAIFKWPFKILYDAPDGTYKQDEHSISSDDPTPSQRMKALVAHIHHEILFSNGLRSVKSYNNLPLKTRADLNEHLANLRDSHHAYRHILTLASSFVSTVSDFLDCYIDKEYDCIIKGKVWAALIPVIETFLFPSSDDLFSFHCEVISIPLRKFIDQIQDLRDGLSGTDRIYITSSMVKAFVQVVLLLADAASEASRLMKKIDSDSKRDSQDASTSTQPDIQSSETQNAEKETDNTAPLDAEAPTKQTEFTNNTNRHIEKIFTYLDQAQDECCATYRSEDNAESTYSGVDRGRIIALIIDSVLCGHSTCASLPELDIVEIYATYTTYLQLQARSRPSKALLMDMNLLREELEIITNNVGQQLDLISALCDPDSDGYFDGSESDFGQSESPIPFEMLYSSTSEGHAVINTSTRRVLQKIKTDLRERKDVADELISRVERLEKQTVQRVDIIEEDHGKAILIFTIISTIFLPLSFVTSYLGMNTSDIRDMEPSQALFWEVATPFTVVVVSVVLVVAYNANSILGWIPRGPAFS
ncbi:hypothetical protein AWENTII_007312 [Aspergillus wentii]